MNAATENNWLKSPGPHKLDRRQWVSVLLVITILSALWAAAVASYSDQPKGVQPAVIRASEGLQVVLSANNFNTSTEELGLQIKLRGFGTIVDDKGTLQESIALRIIDDQNSQVIRLAKGDPLSAKSLSTQLDGDLSTYPFDSYSGQFFIDAEKVSGTGVHQPLEISVGTKRADTGWFTPVSTSNLAANEVQVNISAMKRERFHIMFAVMMTLLLLLLASISIVVGFLCITNRRASEPSLISWLGGIMIAMTLTRRMMPGDPPLGCALDVYLFSWALIFGISAIALAMVAWVRQSRAKLQGS